MCIVVRPRQDKQVLVSVSILQVYRDMNKELRWIHPSNNFVTFPGAVCENANPLAAKSQAHFSSYELKPGSKEFSSVHKLFGFFLKKKVIELTRFTWGFHLFTVVRQALFTFSVVTLGVGQHLAQLASEVSSDNTLLPSVLFSQVVHH